MRCYARNSFAAVMHHLPCWQRQCRPVPCRRRTLTGLAGWAMVPAYAVVAPASNDADSSVRSGAAFVDARRAGVVLTHQQRVAGADPEHGGSQPDQDGG